MNHNHDRNNGRDSAGRFDAGNPGRPKGARNKVTVLAEKLMADEAEAIVRSVVDAARNGDMVAAKLVLERLAPVRRGRPVTLDLPEVRTAEDVFAAMSATISAMADGDITPEEAAVVAGVLDTKRKTIETLEIERRLEALERKAITG